MDDCTVISKKEVFYLWPFGLATWLWGTIFIDRLNAEKAQESVNKTGKTIRDRKVESVFFYRISMEIKMNLFYRLVYLCFQKVLEV